MHPIEHLRYIARAKGVDAASVVRETAVALGSLRADPANLVIACRQIVGRHVTVAPLWWLCAELLTTTDDPNRLAWDLADEIESDPTADLLAEAMAVQWPGTATVLTVGYSDVVAAALIERADATVWCADSGHSGTAMLQRLERGLIDCEPVPADAVGNAVDAADAVLVEALAAAPGRILVAAGTFAVASAAYVVGTPVWLATPMGTRLPAQYVDAIARVAIDEVAVFDREFDDLPPAMISRVLTPDRNANGMEPDAALAGGAAFAPELLRAAHGRQ